MLLGFLSRFLSLLKARKLDFAVGRPPDYKSKFYTEGGVDVRIIQILWGHLKQQTELVKSKWASQ